MTEDMRGLFFIVKGQYRKGEGKKVVNDVSGDYMWLGGYDPTLKDTPSTRWYMCLDRETYTVVCCSSSLEKVLGSVKHLITKHKTRGHYLHSLGDTKTPPITAELFRAIDNEFGDYFRERVEEMEDLAYEVIKDNDPVLRARKRTKTLKKVNTSKGDNTSDTPSGVVFDMKKTLREERPVKNLGVRPRLKKTKKVSLDTL